jgi:hypothetical protein
LQNSLTLASPNGFFPFLPKALAQRALGLKLGHEGELLALCCCSAAAACCLLLAACCLLAAAGCWLLAAGCWLLAAGCWLLAAVFFCWLLAS